MATRRKLAIYIDYSIRIPSFNNAYAAFKSNLFDNKESGLDSGEENLFDTIRFYWKNQLKDNKAEEFYLTTLCKKTDVELKTSSFREYFYNEEHFKKFIEDYSYNLYVDAEVTCKKDIDIINIAQTYLFDIVLVDEYICNRKKANTLFFLSKSRLFPYSLIFLNENQPLSENENEYFGIWNPKINEEQENGDGLGNFEIWIKELEIKLKEETFGKWEGKTV